MLIKEILTEAGEAPTYYFAYGMLTDPSIMTGPHLIGPATLQNFTMEMLQYANVIPSPGDYVVGALWEINREWLHHLDSAEGYPTLYDRKTVPVYHRGEKYVAELYTMTPATRKRLQNTKPSDDYIASIHAGYTHAGIPLQQLDYATEHLYAYH
jgi:gamma-glutamylcyclotransferase (GGCT)/AIG2-like uncharacterized protein YtfP